MESNSKPETGLVQAVKNPVRIQLSRKKGWRMPAGAVNVSRPTIWGNPYLVNPKRSAKEAVRSYRMGVRDGGPRWPSSKSTM